MISWLIVALATVIGIAPLLPVGVPGDPPRGAFSVDRALGHVRQIAGEPRPIGSPGNRRARAYLVAELRRIGLEPELQTIEAPDYYGVVPGETVAVTNVIARIVGAESARAVAVVGHYDTVPGSPGANDDGAAVGVMLEAARALLAAPTLRNDVLLVFTDGEEPAPRHGSTAFAASDPGGEDVGFVVNLEALGATGPPMLTQTSHRSGWVVDEFVKAVASPVAFSFVTATARIVGGSSTDLAPFRDAGVPGLELAYLHGSPVYHTSRDTPDRVARPTVQQLGDDTLGLLHHFGGLDLRAAPETNDAVFFTLGRYVVARYPGSVALAVTALAGTVLLLTAWRRHRSSRGHARLALRLLAPFLSITVAGLAATGAWTALASQRTTMGVLESYLYLAGLLGLVIGISSAISRLVTRQTGLAVHAGGVIAVWWALALATSAAAVGFSYLFTWPALAAALALAAAPVTVRPAVRLAAFALVAGSSLILLAPAIDTFYQLAQPRPGNPDSQLLPLIFVPATLAALVVELLRAAWPRARSGLSPGVGVSTRHSSDGETTRSAAGR